MEYIIAAGVAVVVVGVWALYFFRSLLPAKRKELETQARQQAEQEAESFMAMAS